MPTPRSRSFGHWLALLAAGGAALATAQQPAGELRGRCAGWVPGADGKRLVGADVTLLSRRIPARPDLGVTDEMHVRTDDDGM